MISSVVRAIGDLDADKLRSLIEEGESLEVLREEDDEEYLEWHIHKNFLPESNNVQGVKELREKLEKGNQILRVLGDNGFYIDGIGENYADYSLIRLVRCANDDEEAPEYYEFPEGALWTASSPVALEHMIKAGGNVNITDSFGRSALSYIASSPEDYINPVLMIKILLDNGASFEAGVKNPLEYALEDLWLHDKAAPIVRALIEGGAKCSDEDFREWSDADTGFESKIYEAAFAEEMIRLKNGESKLTVSELDLLTASYIGDFDTIRVILWREPQINVNVQTQDKKYTPLMFAVRGKNTAAAETLLDAGADPNLRNFRGMTAMFEAISSLTGYERLNMVQCLIYSGADPTIKDNEGETAYTKIFEDRISWHDIRLAGLLIQNGVDVDAPDCRGRTPLILRYLLRTDDELLAKKMVSMLIYLGANVNATDSEGKTPLMHIIQQRCATDSQKLSIIKMLVDAGADTSLTDNEGNTALSLFLDNAGSLKYYQNKTSLGILLSKGVYLDATRASWTIRDFPFITKWKCKPEWESRLDEIFREHSTEELINALEKREEEYQSIRHRDDCRKAFMGAALRAGNIEVFKACMKLDEFGKLTWNMIIQAIRSYDIDALQFFIDAEVFTIDAEVFTGNPKHLYRHKHLYRYFDLGWHFVINDVPDRGSEDFRKKLNKGTVILQMLHEVDADIPVSTPEGRKLSYINVMDMNDVFYSRDYQNYEFSFHVDDEVSLLRHAPSPVILRELIDSELWKLKIDEMGREENSSYDFIMSEEKMEMLSRMFSPADFVQDVPSDIKHSELKQRIRASFTPEDFVTDNEDNEDNRYYEDEEDEEDIGEDSILHILARYCNEYFDAPGMIKTVCDNGADVNAKSHYATPLMLTADNASALCTYALINAGADIKNYLINFLNDNNYTNTDDFKELIFSVYLRKELMFIEVIRTLIYGTGRENNNLIAASFDGDILRIRKALSRGADVNVRTQREYTPLMLAAFNGHSEAVKILLEAGADVHACDTFGNNAAAVAGNGETVKLLAEAGADLESRNEDDMTPIMCANDTEKIKALAELGADINAKTKNGKSALVLAEEKDDSYELIEVLLRNGADPSPLIKQD